MEGKNIGTWNFFDNNGYKKAVAEWKDGHLVHYIINLSDTAKVIYETKSNRLYNAESQIVTDSSIREVFNHSTEAMVVNNEMFGLSNYASLIILSKDLKVLFNLKQIKDKEFWELYNRRSINLQLNDTFWKDGLDYSIKDGSIYTKLYYRNTYHDIEPRVSNFAFPLKT